jgi:hypothetical protein
VAVRIPPAPEAKLTPRRILSPVAAGLKNAGGYGIPRISPKPGLKCLYQIFWAISVAPLLPPDNGIWSLVIRRLV